MLLASPVEFILNMQQTGFFRMPKINDSGALYCIHSEILLEALKTKNTHITYINGIIEASLAGIWKRSRNVRF